MEIQQECIQTDLLSVPGPGLCVFGSLHGLLRYVVYLGEIKRNTMPIKHRVEGFVERYFADKQVNI